MKKILIAMMLLAASAGCRGRDAQLEKRIIQAVTACQQRDQTAMDGLVLPGQGIYVVYMPGANQQFTKLDKLSFYDPVPGYEGVFYDDFFGNLTLDDKTVHFDRGLPSFDCGEGEWDKPAGIYCDKGDSPLSSIAKFDREYLGGDWSDEEIEKLEKMEESSRAVIALGTEGADFTFYLTFSNGDWWLSVIVVTDECAA